jgi:hypothetical protein
MFGSRGHFKTGSEFTVDQLAATMVQVMIFAIERQHAVHLPFAGQW